MKERERKKKHIISNVRIRIRFSFATIESDGTSSGMPIKTILNENQQHFSHT